MSLPLVCYRRCGDRWHHSCSCIVGSDRLARCAWRLALRLWLCEERERALRVWECLEMIHHIHHNRRDHRRLEYHHRLGFRRMAIVYGHPMQLLLRESIPIDWMHIRGVNGPHRRHNRAMGRCIVVDRRLLKPNRKAIPTGIEERNWFGWSENDFFYRCCFNWITLRTDSLWRSIIRL